jgi:hypothetical protein
MHPVRSTVVTPVALGVATLAVLATDAATRSEGVQVVLGAIAFGVLFVLTARGPAADRRAIWGVYRYRLHNVPLYVPPGHGLVYLMSLQLSRTPLFASRPRRTTAIAVGIALAWCIGGLTVEPLLLHRIDIFGAFWAMYFVTFSLRTSRGVFFAAVFAVTSLLELAGTGLSDWTWQVTDPVLGIGSGNPPSVIAGGYCVIEASVILVTRALTRLGAARSQRRGAAAAQAEVA